MVSRWRRRSAPVLTLALLLAVGLVAVRLGWVDSLLDRRDAGASAAPREPWQETVRSPPALATSTAAPDPARVRRALAGQLKAADLGAHVVAQVSGLTGGPLASIGTGAATPASTTKLLTSAAALHVFGPEATFATRLLSPRPGVLVLVGGGDPLLASKPVSARAPLRRADLVTLARAAAAKLRAAGLTRVRLSYDDLLFTGPATSPAWPASYVPEDVVSPVNALRVDEGRLPAGAGGGRDLTPALTTARLVAGALRTAGIAVAPRIRDGRGRGEEIARVTSAPLREIVQHTLETSDNDAAETLAHLVGTGPSGDGDGSFAGGVAGVERALTALGVPLAGVRLEDGSGLSRSDLVTPAALTAVLRRAVSDPALQALSYGLPVAGFSGSLAARFVDRDSEAGLGVVRAKTGTLTGVSALAGFVTDADGTPLIYVVIADRVPVTRTLAARASLDDAGAALAACHCSLAPPRDPTPTPTPTPPKG